MAEGGKSKHLMLTMRMDTISQQWEKTLLILADSIQDMAFTIDAPNQLAYISGKADPQSLLNALVKAKATASVCRIDYNYGQFFGAHREFYPNIYPDDSSYNSYGSNSDDHGQFCFTHDKQVHQIMHRNAYGYNSYGSNSSDHGQFLGTHDKQFHQNIYRDDYGYNSYGPNSYNNDYGYNSYGPNSYNNDYGYNSYGPNSYNNGQIFSTHDKQFYKNIYNHDDYGYNSHGQNSFSNNQEGYPMVVPSPKIQEVPEEEDDPKREEPKELVTEKTKKKKSPFMRFMGVLSKF